MPTHTQHRLYTCNPYNREFSRADNLVAHRLTHGCDGTSGNVENYSSTYREEDLENEEVRLSTIMDLLETSEHSNYMPQYTPLTGMSPLIPAPITDTGNGELWDTIGGDARAYTSEPKPRQNQRTSPIVLSPSPPAGSTFSHRYDATNSNAAATPGTPSTSTDLGTFWDFAAEFESKANTRKLKPKQDQKTSPTGLSSSPPAGSTFSHRYDATNSNAAATPQTPSTSTDLFWTLQQSLKPRPT